MKKYIWLLPAAASLAFLVFSAEVVATEGPLGFLRAHARNGWGMQIGIDLVNSVFVALAFAAPAARKVGVRTLPWIVLTVFTGSIGLFALYARVLHARYARDVATGPAIAARAV